MTFKSGQAARIVLVATLACGVDAGAMIRQMLDPSEDAAKAAEKAAFELESANAGDGSWKQCAGENEPCNCVGTMRFGATDHFFTKEVSATTPCVNGQFGGDPAPGEPKKCWCKGADTSPSMSPWKDCSNENELCHCSGTIRYGSEAKDRYRIKEDVSGDTMCNNGIFGGDPVPGEPKRCFCKAGPTSASPPATPFPTFNPTSPVPSIMPTYSEFEDEDNGFAKAFPTPDPTSSVTPPAEAEKEEVNEAENGGQDLYTFAPSEDPITDDDTDVTDSTVNNIGQGTIAQNNEDDTASDSPYSLDNENIMNTPISEDNLNQAISEMDKKERSLEDLPASPADMVNNMVSKAREKVDALPNKRDANAVKAAVGNVLEQMEREEEIKLAKQKPGLDQGLKAYISNKMSTYSSWLTPAETESLTTEAIAMTQELPSPQDHQTVDRLVHAIVNRHLKTKRAEEARNLDLAEEGVQTFDDDSSSSSGGFEWGPHIEIGAGIVGGTVLIVFAAKMVKQRLGTMAMGGDPPTGLSGSPTSTSKVSIRQSSSKYGTHAAEGESQPLTDEPSDYDTL